VQINGPLDLATVLYRQNKRPRGIWTPRAGTLLRPFIGTSFVDTPFDDNTGKVKQRMSIL